MGFEMSYTEIDVNLDPNQVQNRGFWERVLYAILFEVIAIWLSAKFASIVFGHEMNQLLFITVVVAIFAMMWNVLYNVLFDRWLRAHHMIKTRKVRTVHMLMFEFSLMVATCPFIAYYLDISLLEALILDGGFCIFYLVYTYVFAWTYDHLRVLLFKYCFTDSPNK